MYYLLTPGESFVGWPAVEFAGESTLKPFAPIRSYRREETLISYVV
jgi:hypothetical protein